MLRTTRASISRLERLFGRQDRRYTSSNFAHRVEHPELLRAHFEATADTHRGGPHRGIAYDCLNYYPEALRFLIHEVGSDRIVIGTDLFAARDIEYPNSFVEQLNLPAADLDRILKGNAIRLLHL